MNNELQMLKDILCERLGADPEKITPETAFDELGADSLDLLDVVMDIEDKLKVTVPDEMLTRLKTVGDAVEMIKNI